VSNDNLFSESLFRTLKYRPEWPSSGFSSLSDVRDWAQNFSRGYNNEHRHSKVNFVTPAQRHRKTPRMSYWLRVLSYFEVAEYSMSNGRWDVSISYSVEGVSGLFIAKMLPNSQRKLVSASIVER
jgi:hypothetical protein